MNKKCLVVGISGPTTAGKTTLSELIKDNFDCSVMHEDHYFNYPRIKNELKGNHEIPEAIDSDKFTEDVKKEIASGKHTLLLVEGFQIYWYEQLIELLDVRIFLDVDDDTIRHRRMKINKCSEEYFTDHIIKYYHVYKEKALKTPNLQKIDSTKIIAQVYK
jgi:uridine kinase